METSIAIRKIDELGRIVLPEQLRERLDWKGKDSLSVSLNLEDNTVILKLEEKYLEPECNSNICINCKKELI